MGLATNSNRGYPPRSGGSNEGSESRSFDSIYPLKAQARERPRSAGSNLSMDHFDIPSRARHWASMDEKDILGPGPIDVTRLDLDFTVSSDTPSASQTSVSAK